MQRLKFFIFIPIHFLCGIPYLGLIHLIGLFNRPLRVKMAYGYNRLTAWWLFWAAGAKFDVEGIDNLYQDTNVLYVSNHRSMLDIPLMMKYVKKPMIFIGKDSIKKWPFIGWWLHAMDGLFLNRTNPREGLKTILHAIDRIKNGESCIIYPEGTRSRTKEMLPFKPGSFKLATKPNIPIVPMAVLGTADVFENNKINLRPEKVYLKVGKPIILDQLTSEDQRNISKYVQNIIQGMYDDLLAKQAKDKI